jgi:hypothetical protein
MGFHENSENLRNFGVQWHRRTGFLMMRDTNVVGFVLRSACRMIVNSAWSVETAVVIDGSWQQARGNRLLESLSNRGRRFSSPDRAATPDRAYRPAAPHRFR